MSVAPSTALASGVLAYARPRTVDELLDLIERHGPKARLLAGGSDLVTRMRMGHVRPELVIDLKHVAGLETRPVVAAGLIRIGARAVVTDVIADPAVVRHVPALIDAGRVVGSVQIRNRATVVGNACNASPAADTVPALLVHGATVTLRRRAGTRSIALADFAVAPGKTTLGHDEFVESIDVPLPVVPTASAFVRLTRRRGVDLAVISASALVNTQGLTRIALGAAGPRVIVSDEATGVLADPRATENDRNAAIARIVALATPRSDVRAGDDYRRAMLTVFVERALALAHSRLAAFSEGA